MKFPIPCKSIFIFLLIGLGLVGCKKKPTASKISNQLKVDSIDSSSKMETSSNLATTKSATEINFSIPEGYNLFHNVKGDLNGDGLEDHVIIIKGTEKAKIVVNRFEEEVDRNRRGIMIFLTTEKGRVLVTKNLNCFSSENEDGGVYFAPELSFKIENGNLYIHYGHGRYGYWKYTFRYQNADFELIGYDSSNNFGPIINLETSINFLTKKKLTRENVNQDGEGSGDEIFEETWDQVPIEELYRLSQIEDFDEFNLNNL